MFSKVRSAPMTVSGEIPIWVFSAVSSLLNSLKESDESTYHHCLRVAEGCRRFAIDLGLSQYQQRVAQFAGALHDIGKIGIHQSILHKPGKLSPEEYSVMKSHAEMSERIVAPLASQHEFFQQILPALRNHHERIDGLGYPDRLVGDEIPLIARLILIIDTLDAMGQDRVYRKGLPIEQIYQELHQFSNTQFDARLVKIFLKSHPLWEKDQAQPTVELLKVA